jgi:hypothetical protein
MTRSKPGLAILTGECKMAAKNTPISLPKYVDVKKIAELKNYSGGCMGDVVRCEDCLEWSDGFGGFYRKTLTRAQSNVLFGIGYGAGNLTKKGTRMALANWQKILSA